MFRVQKVNNMASSSSTLCILSVQFNGAFEACLMSTNSSLKKPFPYFPCFCLSDAIKCGMGWALRRLRPPAAGWCNELVLSTASGLIFTMFCPGHWAPGPSIASMNNTLSCCTWSPPLSQISAMKGFTLVVLVVREF